MRKMKCVLWRIGEVLCVLVRGLWSWGRLRRLVWGGGWGWRGEFRGRRCGDGDGWLFLRWVCVVDGLVIRCCLA